MNKIRPCPFCGKEPRLLKHIFDEDDEDYCYGIVCECGAKGFQFFDKAEEAIEAWNRRAGEQDE